MRAGTFCVIVALVVSGIRCVPAPSGSTPADRYWVGGAGKWDDPAHWALSSGGQGGATPPDGTCDAFFDENSGAGTVVEITTEGRARDLIVSGTADPGLTLAFRGATLACGRDCLLQTGRVDQGSTPSSVLAVGRNLDTADCELSWRGKGNLSVRLTGAGQWRYSLEDKRKPSVWDLAAASPGQTTTLRPVGVAPGGRDIDVENQCIFGDSSSLLTMDVSEATGVRGQPPAVTIEIHHARDALDIVADGCRVQITSLEHEMHSKGPGRLQNKLDLTGLTGKYDVTGSYMTEAGAGPTWTLEGPLDLGDGHLAIEKTVVFDTAGHDLKCERISLTFGGMPELRMGGGDVTVTGRVNLGGKQPGRIDLGTGRLTCRQLIVGHPEAAITGGAGGLLQVLESHQNPGGAELDSRYLALPEATP